MPMGGQPQPQAVQPAVAQAMPMGGQPQPGYGQPAMAMPMGGQQMMQQQAPSQMVAQGSVGLQMFAPFGDMFIKQRVELLEAITGFETANAYDIFAGGHPGAPIFYAGEQSDCCTRNCCGSIRPFSVAIMAVNNPAQPVMSISRPLRCDTPLCCCYLQEIDVFEGPLGGKLVGKLCQTYSVCGSEFDVVVGGHQLVYRISGPCCVCDGPCCEDQHFMIKTPSGMHIDTPAGPARITKMGGGDIGHAVQQAMTGT